MDHALFFQRLDYADDLSVFLFLPGLQNVTWKRDKQSSTEDKHRLAIAFLLSALADRASIDSSMLAAWFLRTVGPSLM